MPTALACAFGFNIATKRDSLLDSGPVFCRRTHCFFFSQFYRKQNHDLRRMLYANRVKKR